MTAKKPRPEPDAAEPQQMAKEEMAVPRFFDNHS